MSVCNHTRDYEIKLPAQARSSDFVITRMVTDRIGLHSVLLPLLTICLINEERKRILINKETEYIRIKKADRFRTISRDLVSGGHSL